MNPSRAGGIPLVTIGIPTYNRERWLARAIDSALGQDHAELEVIVSDNASSDGTPAICEEYARRDARFTFFRMPENRGSTANFNAVLSSARGEYFMWLGDDDWIDEGYVSRCLRALVEDPGLALASGQVRYYREGRFDRLGDVLDILHSSAVRRVLDYYWRVTDNGMFYGVMRTAQLQRAPLRNVMGNDWHTIAAMLASGGARTLPQISVHRELGGASASPEAIARTLKLSRIQMVSPTISIASSAFSSVRGFARHAGGGGGARWWLAAAGAFLTVLAKHARIYAAAVPRLLSRGGRHG